MEKPYTLWYGPSMVSAKTRPGGATKAERVVLYARISEDSSGEAAGVARQLEDLRALAKVRGWDVVAELSDNNVSAFAGRHRPGYRDLMDLVESGGVDRVAVWHMSRLWRNRAERAADLTVCQDAGVSISAVRGPEIDLSSAAGRMVAGLLGEFDSYESDVKSERVARASEQRAAEGRANGATPYGYRKVKGAKAGVLEPDPKESREVALMVSRIIGGDSLRAVCADLNRRGVPTPGRAAEWRPSTVIKTIKRPAIAGLRDFRGEIIGAAQWPGIVSEEDWRKVAAVLADPARRTNLSDNRRRYLLSGKVGACGVCFGPLRGVTRKPGKYGNPLTMYLCERTGCTGRGMGYVDDLVADVVLAYLDRPENAEATRAAASRTRYDKERDPEVLRARMAEASAAFAQGLLALEDITIIRDNLTERLAALEAETSQEVTPQARRAVARLRTAKDRRRVWQGMSVEDRHGVVSALFERVVILPTTRRGPGFDPESVRFDWRDAA